MKLIVDPNICCGSGECLEVCPVKAIRLVEGIAVIDMSLCDLDGICIPACPNQAIDYRES